MFGDTAARLAGLAARVLGWRPGELRAATPAELALSLGAPETSETPSRSDLVTMIARDAKERDRDGRSD